jgi:hypothetical protein
MFPLWFILLGGFIVFLDVGPSILFLVFPPFFWVLWFISDWQGFINRELVSMLEIKHELKRLYSMDSYVLLTPSPTESLTWSCL